ncbi:hypothetical protein [Nissabacter archeti]|uniref:hypothetical protein n=1 Tax=Nissabacter archeti TaxID=1917880 RepID=UPI0009341507|nr:hypothetical protein [Nissabacter archeti]
MITVQKQPFSAAAAAAPTARQPAPGRARAYPTPSAGGVPSLFAAKCEGLTDKHRIFVCDKRPVQARYVAKEGAAHGDLFVDSNAVIAVKMRAFFCLNGQFTGSYRYFVAPIEKNRGIKDKYL